MKKHKYAYHYISGPELGGLIVPFSKIEGYAAIYSRYTDEELSSSEVRQTLSGLSQPPWHASHVWTRRFPGGHQRPSYTLISWA